MDLIEMVVRHLQNGGLVECDLTEEGRLAYKFNGFCKSGHAKLYEVNGLITCETRYGQIDLIAEWSDLVDVAYNWWQRERDSSSPPEPWAEEFVKAGYVRKVMVEMYEKLLAL